MKLSPTLFVTAVLGLVAALIVAFLFLGTNAGMVAGVVTTLLAAVIKLGTGEDARLPSPVPVEAASAKPDLKIIAGGQP